MPINYDYNRDYEPAAPTIPISLSRSGATIASQETVALVDTGADATMIPIDLLRSVGARYVQQRQMRGIVGEAITVNLYLTAVHVDDLIVHGIRAVAVPAGAEAILGRDVLNQWEVTLNGPALEISIA